MPSKITSAGDSKYRVINKSYNGGDCWINISKDLKPLFNYKKDELFDIRIHKEDFIKAINIISILSYGELWECPSKDLIPFHFSNKWFELAYAQITKKFGNEDIAVYKAKHGMYSQGRSYILNNDSDLNIRDFLIERHSILTIELGSDGILDLRVETSIEDLQKSIITGETSINFAGNTKKSSLQKIIYGAPGTGKSFRIKDDTKGNAVIRTTFHPDSDYATFVGAYKPTMGIGKVYGAQGPLQEKIDGKLIDTVEPKITYEFVMQAFLKAYLAAWKYYAEDNVNPKLQFLVIEEINRGNCAQIFGDLFQLLDRSQNRFSTYPIEADSDLQRIIEKSFKDSTLYKLGPNDIDADGAVKDYTSNYGATLSEDIQHGRILLLPPNLLIWATMNTSDQSLFPIDSAFKRRWDWEYIPIANANKNWKIKVAGKRYDWWDFLNNINDIVEAATSSEDKKLGYFFVKADDENNISAEKFVSKVVFYLWNDVFKDYGFDWKNKEGKPVFKDEQGNDLTFKKFFYPDGSVIETIVAVLLDNLLVSTEEEVEAEDPAAPAINGAHKHLRSVAFTDGIVFDSNNTKSHFEIYLETIKKIGVEWAAPLIENMGYRRLDSPLVTRIKYPELENSDTYSYLKVEDFYFVKGGNDDTLIAVLEGLNKQLTDKITINYV